MLLYLVSQKFRLAAEVRAYKRQIEVGGVSKAEAALALLGYRLGINYSEAMRALV